MKKNIVSILIGLVIVGISGITWAKDKTEKPANVIVVAKSGGDYTSISAALAAINPTADNPYVVKVMPGVYNETITMKSYVHLQGAGRDVTRIVWTNNPYFVIECSDVINATISGLSLEGGTGINNSNSSLTIRDNRFTAYYTGSGINNINSSPIIDGNIIEECYSAGIKNSGNSKPVISNNKIIGNGSSNMTGIKNDGWSLPTITNNIIEGTSGGIDFAGGGGMVSSEKSIIDGNIIEGNETGISLFGISPIISNNTIRGNSDGIGFWSYGWGGRPDGSFCCISAPTINSNVISDNGGYGIGGSGNPIITHNKVTTNATGDISVTTWPETTTSVGFNVYDIISGSGMVGGYNLKSDGTPASLP